MYRIVVYKKNKQKQEIFLHQKSDLKTTISFREEKSCYKMIIKKEKNQTFFFTWIKKTPQKRS